MITVGSLPMEAAYSKKHNEGAVQMSKKLTPLHLPNSDKDALVIAGECVPAGKPVANKDDIVPSALIEGRNHKVASTVQLHDHPVKFIKPQITAGKAIPTRMLCQILIPPNSSRGGKNALFLPYRILGKVQSWLGMPYPPYNMRTINGVKTNSLRLHHI